MKRQWTDLTTPIKKWFLIGVVNYLFAGMLRKNQPENQLGKSTGGTSPLDNTYNPCYSYYDNRTTTDVAMSDVWTGGRKAMNSISSDVIRGYNDTMILYLLLRNPSYGYEISKQIKDLSSGKYIIKETTLYSAFTRMERNGYIEAFSAEKEGTGKRRTYYRMTELGRRYYHEKCEEWNLTKEVVEHFIEKEGEHHGDD